MLQPRDAKDVVEIIGSAVAAGRSLEIAGGGTKRTIGRPVAADECLDLSAFNRIVLYEPEELVLTVEAGAQLESVQSLLADANQEFAFEPMRPAALLGVSAKDTIGGMIGSGLAGPRRFKAGGIRDHLLGASAVSGFGEIFKAGGRVVKNVTGYDVCKLLAGSWGRLAVMTEVTLKVMPKAESELTLVLTGLDAAAAGRAMIAAVNSPFDISGAAYLPPSTLRNDGQAARLMERGPTGTAFLRLEGIDISVRHRANLLADQIKAFGSVERLDDVTASRSLWAEFRDVMPFAADGPLGAWSVWRIVCPPASGITIGSLLARVTGGEVIYDWGGGLIWAALPPAARGDAGLPREHLKQLGGHAMLVRGDEKLRSRVDILEPQPPALAALEERLRLSFDPCGVFHPARFAPASSKSAQDSGAPV